MFPLLGKYFWAFLCHCPSLNNAFNQFVVFSKICRKSSFNSCIILRIGHTVFTCISLIFCFSFKSCSFFNKGYLLLFNPSKSCLDSALFERNLVCFFNLLPGLFRVFSVCLTPCLLVVLHEICRLLPEHLV